MTKRDRVLNHICLKQEASLFSPALLNLEVLRSKVFWKRWDVGCRGQMSLSLSSHFNRWRWWINLLLISGWILHFCCKMPNGKILGSESDNTETHFHGYINVLDMKLMMCFFSSDKVLMFWWRTADYLKCYLWNVLLFCMNPTTVNQKILSSCLVCNFHIIVSMLCKAEKSYIKSSFFTVFITVSGTLRKGPDESTMPLSSDAITRTTRALCAFPKWPCIETIVLFFMI